MSDGRVCEGPYCEEWDDPEEGHKVDMLCTYPETAADHPMCDECPWQNWKGTVGSVEQKTTDQAAPTCATYEEGEGE